MNGVSSLNIAEFEARYPDVFNPPALKRFLPLLIGAATILYLVYCWWFFSIGTVLATGQWQRAEIYARDWVSYAIRSTVRMSPEGTTISYPRFSELGDNPKPDWVVQNGRDVTITFGTGKSLRINGQRVIAMRGGEELTVLIEPDGAKPQGRLPTWATLKEDQVTVNFGFAGTADIIPERVVISRRFLGWANFVFDTASPFWNRSAGEVASMIFSGERIRPEISNAALAFDNIWYNSSWQHGDVWTKLLQTIVMAFVGTLLATLISLPLAFIAARNITPNFFANQMTKRFFDFLRSVDMLIWALFFTRAFGPGPLAGISAIFFTDTGTLGKVYSETLENIDDKQREGVKSVGASPMNVQRYGVIPQVLPVFASQALYFWESNTRSATIIGAVGAGGIGLKLWEAMRTNTNWHNVAYMVLLILAVVFIFDSISNALRSRLMGKQQ
ncbi:phosphonate ABC transporter, permease protein PhnE [Phyllobacterium endophyticum]|uniref:Phosphonate ABC transporter, permease protein PhnE n=1 Tax=Phyllobacterium endophyticum TaxID=1149773 RepID=A0A2P7ATZ8_9HYPH|nr:phosphonate ABC transporter, permease protein PhnE [Phyllobacterium endophyticum]MBB3234124.1 phosphonate transport system permease protein [Phyllobacterium endophyticum]PSH57692.1 phosphonate ABC transporter, permease protein PhnE [Phyllobacterium endophyticum]TYR43885.1 phosphonate ABC transporter, permease protein PhnE [Phyllobacterium endophyticum]